MVKHRCSLTRGSAPGSVRCKPTGTRIYLHGYSHQSAPRYGGVSPGGRLSWLFAQRIASGGEAEMADVSEEQGRSRVERGERVLRDAGLRIDGFVAPAWSMPRWVIPWLGSRGYRYSEDHFRVYDPAAARSRASLVLNWATRSRWRLVSTVAFCRVAKIGRAWAPARIAIHPADMRFRLVRSEIQRMLDWARADVVQRGADLLA